MGVFDLPITLQLSALVRGEPPNATYSKEFAQGRVVGLAWLSLDVFLSDCQLRPASSSLEPTKSFVNQKRKQPSMRPRSSSESPMLSTLA